MKTFIAMVVTLFCVAPVGAQYVVVNKCANGSCQYTVVNKTTPQPVTLLTTTGETIKWTGTHYEFVTAPVSTGTTPTATATAAPLMGLYGVTSGGCANGNCAVPTQTSGGLFRRR